jgi:hypothetical protein
MVEWFMPRILRNWLVLFRVPGELRRSLLH